METMYIHVYKGSGITRLIHYEDAGDGYDFQDSTYFKREIILDSDSKEVTIGNIEGTSISRFPSLTVFFHGFDQNRAKVDGKEVLLERRDVTYLEKLSDFDPLPSGKHPFHTCK